jgi:hypothetical protein
MVLSGLFGTSFVLSCFLIHPIVGFWAVSLLFLLLHLQYLVRLRNAIVQGREPPKSLFAPFDCLPTWFECLLVMSLALTMTSFLTLMAAVCISYWNTRQRE